MDTVVVQQGGVVAAAVQGRQSFVGGGPGSLVQMNGDPADYVLVPDVSEDPDDASGYALVAVNGTGEYHFDPAIERIGFISGAYSLARGLAAVISSGDRTATRLLTTTCFTSYAQIREDVLLLRALRDVPADEGFYIDVGAFDPDHDTITKAFYERGWRGINLEPSAVHHARLQHRRPRDVNLCIAASAASGHMRFFGNDGEQLGTLEARFASPASVEAAVEVPTERLADVCREHVAGDIHFLKIDVEGHERSVLEGCDFSRYRPWIVVVEAVAPNRADVATFGEWEDILLDAGYHLAGEDELNRFYVSQEKTALSRHFAVPVDHYVSGASLDEQARLSSRLAETDAELSALRQTMSRKGSGWLAKMRDRLA